MTEEQHQQDLKKLQDAIYKEKVLRARAMTPEERLSDVFELCNGVMDKMLAGVMWQKKIENINEAKRELSKQIERLRWVHDHQDKQEQIGA